MNTDRFDGRCRDCFNKCDKLLHLSDPTLMSPACPRIWLCPECNTAREEDKTSGRAARPIGIPADIEGTKWIDFESLNIMFKSGPPIVVKVKARVPTKAFPSVYDGGEVLVQIGDNPWWEQVEHLGGDMGEAWITRYALSSARTKMNQYFSPNGSC